VLSSFTAPPPSRPPRQHHCDGCHVVQVPAATVRSGLSALWAFLTTQSCELEAASSAGRGTVAVVLDATASMLAWLVAFSPSDASALMAVVFDDTWLTQAPTSVAVDGEGIGGWLAVIAGKLSQWSLVCRVNSDLLARLLRPPFIAVLPTCVEGFFQTWLVGRMWRWLTDVGVLVWAHAPVDGADAQLTSFWHHSLALMQAVLRFPTSCGAAREIARGEGADVESEAGPVSGYAVDAMTGVVVPRFASALPPNVRRRVCGDDGEAAQATVLDVLTTAAVRWLHYMLHRCSGRAATSSSADGATDVLQTLALLVRVLSPAPGTALRSRLEAAAAATLALYTPLHGVVLNGGAGDVGAGAGGASGPGTDSDVPRDEAGGGLCACGVCQRRLGAVLSLCEGLWLQRVDTTVPAGPALVCLHLLEAAAEGAVTHSPGHVVALLRLVERGLDAMEVQRVEWRCLLRHTPATLAAVMSALTSPPVVPPPGAGARVLHWRDELAMLDDGDGEEDAGGGAGVATVFGQLCECVGGLVAYTAPASLPALLHNLQLVFDVAASSLGGLGSLTTAPRAVLAIAVASVESLVQFMHRVQVVADVEAAEFAGLRPSSLFVDMELLECWQHVSRDLEHAPAARSVRPYLDSVACLVRDHHRAVSLGAGSWQANPMTLAPLVSLLSGDFAAAAGLREPVSSEAPDPTGELAALFDWPSAVPSRATAGSSDPLGRVLATLMEPEGAGTVSAAHGGDEAALRPTASKSTVMAVVTVLLDVLVPILIMRQYPLLARDAEPPSPGGDDAGAESADVAAITARFSALMATAAGMPVAPPVSVEVGERDSGGVLPLAAPAVGTAAVAWTATHSGMYAMGMRLGDAMLTLLGRATKAAWLEVDTNLPAEAWVDAVFVHNVAPLRCQPADTPAAAERYAGCVRSLWRWLDATADNPQCLPLFVGTAVLRTVCASRDVTRDFPALLLRDSTLAVKTRRKWATWVYKLLLAHGPTLIHIPPMLALSPFTPAAAGPAVFTFESGEGMAASVYAWLRPMMEPVRAAFQHLTAVLPLQPLSGPPTGRYTAAYGDAAAEPMSTSVSADDLQARAPAVCNALRQVRG